MQGDDEVEAFGMTTESKPAPGVPKLQWVLVEDIGKTNFSLLTHYALKTTLQIMGTKPHQATSLVDALFVEIVSSSTVFGVDCSNTSTIRELWATGSLKPQSSTDRYALACVTKAQFAIMLNTVLSKRPCDTDSALVRRYWIASAIVERQQPLIIMFGGTSGCGKSTIANLVGARFGMTVVVSTDNVRELLREQRSQADYPVLHTSTYESHTADPDTSKDLKSKLLDGYQRQSQLVLEALKRMVLAFLRRREAIILEGVHLTSPWMAALAAELELSGVACCPFLIHITNEQKHLERFSIRSRSMTQVSASNNKHVRHFNNIRTIQNYLVNEARRLQLPIINNTNLDRSLAVIHDNVFQCMQEFMGSGRIARQGATSVPSAKETVKKLRARREQKVLQRSLTPNPQRRPEVLGKQRREPQDEASLIGS